MTRTLQMHSRVSVRFKNNLFHRPKISALSLLLLLLVAPAIITAAPPTIPRQASTDDTNTSANTNTKGGGGSGRFQRDNCVSPAPWNQILSFIVTNYIARIATFKQTAGYNGYRDYVKSGLSLFVPFVGISSAAWTIARGSRFFGKDNLGRALHADALCVLQRKEGWRPKNGEVIRGCSIEFNKIREGEKHHRRHRHHRHQGSRGSQETEYPEKRKSAHFTLQPSNLYVFENPLKKWKIQGQHDLPRGYEFARLTPGFALQALNPGDDRKSVTISSYYNGAKSAAAGVQIMFSLYAIYSAYGNQVTQYGFAAFGFSVVPYTVMSLLNAVSNLVEADYDTLFMVYSDVMMEATDRTQKPFVGAVASLVPLEPEKGEDEGLVDVKFKKSKRSGWKACVIDSEGEKVGSTWKIVLPDDPEYLLDHHQAAEEVEDQAMDGGGVSATIVVPAMGEFKHKRKETAKTIRSEKYMVPSLIILALIIPYIVIGFFSKFEARNSTLTQRVFMVGWLVSGQFIGLLDMAQARSKKLWLAVITQIIEWLVVFVGVVFAIGGFVQAGSMMREFGYCSGG